MIQGLALETAYDGGSCCRFRSVRDDDGVVAGSRLHNHLQSSGEHTSANHLVIVHSCIVLYSGYSSHMHYMKVSPCTAWYSTHIITTTQVFTVLFFSCTDPLKIL